VIVDFLEKSFEELGVERGDRLRCICPPTPSGCTSAERSENRDVHRRNRRVQPAERRIVDDKLVVYLVGDSSDSF